MKKIRLFFVLLAALVAVALISSGATWLVQSFQGSSLEEDFASARELMRKGDLAGAETAFASLADLATGEEEWFEEFQRLRLDLARKGGDPAQSAEAARRMIAEGHPAASEAHLILGRAARAAGNRSEAKAHFEKAAGGAAPGSAAAREAEIALALAEFDEQGSSVQARDRMLALLESGPSEESARELESALGRCNLDILYSRAMLEGDKVYEIAKGDNLDSIARRHAVSAEMLMRANGITDPRRLSIGRRLKIPYVDFSIEVDKTANTMVLLNEGRFFKRYQVRTGKADFMTPVGEFKVESRVKDPQWKDPGSGRVFPAGHPENELGTRWMEFAANGIGIHGTIHPETIGKYTSNGCVGLLKDDVEELFDLVRVGTPVRIRGTTSKEIAQSN